MCANYEPIRRNQILQLNLLEPTFDYKTDIFPGYDCPLLFAPDQEHYEWRQVKFGMVPKWAKDLKICRKTYNARTETVHEKPSFKNAWYKSQFALIPVATIFEPKYIQNKPEWWGIARKDEQPFTVAALYESAIIQGQQVRSMTMLTINAEQHPLMNQFHAPTDEKRSIIVIPEDSRLDWLNCSYKEAPHFFQGFPSDEFYSFPKQK